MGMKADRLPAEYVGVVSEATLKTEHLLEAFTTFLLYVRKKVRLTESQENALMVSMLIMDTHPNCFGFYGDENLSESVREEADYLIEDLWDILDSIAPKGTYFGAIEGDGACYGFWALPLCDSCRAECNIPESEYMPHESYCALCGIELEAEEW
jgi:hypothetical protein